MITIRPSYERGHANHGWLDTYHTFSFASYFDPENMGFRALRVINDDRVAARMGFGSHPHRDMEIITYMLDGELTHKDSIGEGGVLRAGDVQHMSAGTGVVHSEFNRSDKELHLLQIWILPEKEGLKPVYDQKNFPAEEKLNALRLIAAGDAKDGALKIHQDVNLYASLLEEGKSVTHTLRPGRHAWVQVAKGFVTVNGNELRPGDGAAISEESTLTFVGTSGDAAEFLLFDLN